MTDKPNKLPRLLTDTQVAEITGLSVSTLATWRCNKRVCIPYVKLGNCVRYREDDVLAFIEGATVYPSKPTGRRFRMNGLTHPTERTQ